MPFLDMGDGNWAHINMGRPRRKRCRFCGRSYYDGKLCDFPTGRGGTCSAPMCGGCATTIGPDLDYCPDHKHGVAQGTLALEASHG
jgi:hypothetical protein